MFQYSDFANIFCIQKVNIITSYIFIGIADWFLYILSFVYQVLKHFFQLIPDSWTDIIVLFNSIHVYKHIDTNVSFISKTFSFLFDIFSEILYKLAFWKPTLIHEIVHLIELWKIMYTIIEKRYRWSEV